MASLLADELRRLQAGSELWQVARVGYRLVVRLFFCVLILFDHVISVFFLKSKCKVFGLHQRASRGLYGYEEVISDFVEDRRRRDDPHCQEYEKLGAAGHFGLEFRQL